MLLSKNYVTCHMIGRLGNQMFQIANAYSQALRHNRQLVLPKHDTSVSDYYSSMFRKLRFDIDVSPNESPDISVINSTYHYTQYEPCLDKPTVFKGYFESELFFKDYSENIRWLYEPTEGFLEKCYKDYPFLKTNNVTAINVRRGDFLTFPNRHPVLTKEYIYRAIGMLPKSEYYLVVSDDIEWCKQNITSLPNLVFSDYIRQEALWLLSQCSYFVISNSTFSWWSAWLSRQPNKIVVAPSVWFGPEILTHTDPKDVYCKDWIKAHSVFQEGQIH